LSKCASMADSRNGFPQSANQTPPVGMAGTTRKDMFVQCVSTRPAYKQGKFKLSEINKNKYRHAKLDWANNYDDMLLT
jgi:hypothetical protein